ncbi:MAG: carbonic anhydrase, partial [Polyangiaceae bacterium]|nr:carbonic anhydrase [Polyangiaceae bacterium]
MSAQDSLIQSLLDGNKRFLADQPLGPHRSQTRRDSLQGGQAPDVIVLSCADSRVAPELLFDVGLGDIFVCRVAGNVANTSTIASIEYAVAHLKSSLIVVLGHESCGAIGAALAGGDNGYNLNHLLAHTQEAIASDHGGDVNTCVKANAKSV